MLWIDMSECERKYQKLSSEFLWFFTVIKFSASAVKVCLEAILLFCHRLKKEISAKRYTLTTDFMALLKRVDSFTNSLNVSRGALRFSAIVFQKVTG